MAAEPQVARDAPREVLGLKQAVAVIVGIVVGAGIFKAPSMVAGATGSAEWMFAAWLLGGLISLAGALCYAELATAYGDAGGDYHFLRRAYGRSFAFLFGWARFAVIVTGSIALLGFVFGDYMVQVAPIPGGSVAWAAIAIVALTLLNLRGTVPAANAQAWLTLLEVGGLVLVIVAGMVVQPAAVATTPAAGAPSASAFGLAMVFVLLTYGGWNEAAYISAEVRDRRRNMVLALVISIVVITALYVAVTWAYWRGLGMIAMGKSDAVAADLLRAAMGAPGEKAIAAIVAVSALTSINATMIVGARTHYAMGVDWRSLGRLAAWNGERAAPTVALRVQCVAALALLALGALTGDGFKAMVEFTAPVFWFFFLMAGLSLFVLRHRDPARERPFRVPLYPITPFVFCAMCAYMLWSSLGYVGGQAVGGINAAWIGIAVLALGGVALLLVRAREARLPSSLAGEEAD